MPAVVLWTGTDLGRKLRRRVGSVPARALSAPSVCRQVWTSGTAPVAWIRKASDCASECSRRVRPIARRPVDRRLTICGSAMRRKCFRTPTGG